MVVLTTTTQAAMAIMRHLVRTALQAAATVLSVKIITQAALAELDQAVI